jgi:hypothetical protein
MNTAVCCPSPTRVPVAPGRSAVLALPGAAGRPAAARRASRRPIPLHRPPWQRLWLALHERWTAWRAEARRRSAMRALATLDRRVLRDVGLDEWVPPREPVTWHDLERARW